MHRLSGNRIDAVAGDRKSELLVEADGARVVGVDVKLEPGRRELLGDGDESPADARGPIFGRDDDLIEIAGLRIDGHKADHLIAGFGNDDVRGLGQLVAPAFAPPVEPPREIDLRIGGLPAAQPKRDRCVFIFCIVGAQRNVKRARA
jgi:hypothetical protein